MVDPATSDALPTPEQMRNYFAAAKSAQKARRLQEASRAIITGNIAAVACMMGTMLVLIHAEMFFVNIVVMFGYIGLAILSLRWRNRQRSRSSVYVLNPFEAQLPPTRRVRARMLLLFVVILLGEGVAFLAIDVNRIPQWSIIAFLSVGPLAAVGYFICRCVIFRFWEDLLFAVAVALAYLPFPFQAWHLAPLCLLTLPMVIVGTISLHFRWVRWQCYALLQNVEAGEEVRP
jgi:hypothetical protein